MAIQIIKGSSTEPTHVRCSECLQRDRRGGDTTFKGSNSADLHQWVIRHIKHDRRRA